MFDDYEKEAWMRPRAGYTLKQKAHFNDIRATLQMRNDLRRAVSSLNHTLIMRNIAHEWRTAS